MLHLTCSIALHPFDEATLAFSPPHSPLNGPFLETRQEWNAWIDPNNKPTRACVEGNLARPGLRVEIQCTAAVPKKRSAL